MKLTKLYFENYKAFAGEHELELRPLTIIIGRNNSGKSALTRLPLLLHQMFAVAPFGELPLSVKDLYFGRSATDLLFEKPFAGYLSLGAALTGEDGAASIIQGFDIDSRDDGASAFVSSIRTDSHTIYRSEDRPSAWTDVKTGKELQQINTETIQFHEVSKYSEENKPKLLRLNLDLIDNVPHEGEQPSDMYVAIQKAIEEIPQIHDQDLDKIKLNIETNYQKIEDKKIWPQIYHIAASRQEAVRRANSKNVELNEIFEDNTDRLFEEAASILFSLHKGQSPLFKEINEWYQVNMHGWSLEVEGEKESIDVYLRKKDHYRVHIADAGSALGQILPIVVRVATIRSSATPGLLLTEEPEKHLHPSAHGALADLYVELVGGGSPHAAIVETHSEVFCLRVQRRIAEGTLCPEDVVIYWVDEGEQESIIKRIDINDQGAPSYWPKGVFSEDFIESKAILKAKQAGIKKTPEKQRRL